jgi:tetratricopeptide (TPR) repeat protein
VSQPLADQLVVFTGKLSAFGRKDARALVARLGGVTADDVTVKTTMLVIGGEGFGPTAEKTHNLRRAEELNTQGPPQIRILTEDQFCHLAGVPTIDAIRQQYHAQRDLLARYRSLREDHLRYLVKCAIIQPVLRTNTDTFFDFAAVAAIKQTNDDMSRGLSFRSAIRSLMAEREGQLTFDFRLDAAPAKILALHKREAPKLPGPPDAPAASPVRDAALAEEYFRVGSALDNGDEAMRDQAAVAYRRALELDPSLVPALINLANIHYSRDELVEAQALYERAIALESGFFEAHFNLGNIYHDLNQFAQAERCYAEALRLNPYYADTHFYLAVTLEKMGQSQQARPHWRSYQQLAPQGEWVELAKEFSE